MCVALDSEPYLKFTAVHAQNHRADFVVDFLRQATEFHIVRSLVEIAGEDETPTRYLHLLRQGRVSTSAKK